MDIALSSSEWLLLAAAVVAAVVLVGALVAWLGNRRSSGRLKERFGPEYARTVEQTGDRGKAERELQSRVDRIDAFELRELGPSQREGFARRWEAIQAEFVDRPPEAVLRADQLLAEVMQASGYVDAAAGANRRAEDLSVADPALAETYRAAIMTAERRSAATTEELRRSLVQLHTVAERLWNGAAAAAR